MSAALQCILARILCSAFAAAASADFFFIAISRLYEEAPLLLALHLQDRISRLTEGRSISFEGGTGWHKRAGTRLITEMHNGETLIRTQRNRQHLATRDELACPTEIVSHYKFHAVLPEGHAIRLELTSKDSACRATNKCGRVQHFVASAIA